jgi:hypothetical protein
MRPEQERLVEVVDAILRYLHSHPHAADTVEGIAKWWLPRRNAPMRASWRPPSPAWRPRAWCIGAPTPTGISSIPAEA